MRYRKASSSAPLFTLEKRPRLVIGMSLVVAIVALGSLDGTSAFATPPPWPSSPHEASELPLSASWRPGEGLSFVSDQERFSLHAGARVQLRYDLNRVPSVQGGVWSQSLQLRRARVKLSGFLWSRHNAFKMELAFSPHDLGMKGGRLTHTPLLDWHFDLTYLRDLTVRVGQFKVPFNRQRLISSGDLQFVDRAMTNSEFNLDRDIGISLLSKDLFGLGCLRYALFLGTGEGRDGFSQSDLGPLIAARLEVFPFGFFSDRDEVDFSRSMQPRLSLGVAYGWIKDAKGDRGIVGAMPADGGTTDTHHVTADVLFKWAGASILGEIFWRDGRRQVGDAVDESGHEIAEVAPRNGYGAMLQAGYLMPWFLLEISGRYALIRPRDGSSLGRQNSLGGGVSYYAQRHALKVQMDYLRSWVESLDIGQDQVRVQLQVAF